MDTMKTVVKELVVPSIQAGQARVRKTISSSSPDQYKSKGHRSKHDRSSSPPCFLSDVPFPTISDWFKALDAHPIQGRVGFNYTRLAEAFCERGFLTVSDLLEISGKELSEELEGFIKPADGRRIISLAKEEAERLRPRKKACY